MDRHRWLEHSSCLGTSLRRVGTHLQRYSSTLRCVEINSCFYRSHARATYARWAAEARPAFQFAVKLPRTITHEQELRRARVPLERFLEETGGLGEQARPDPGATYLRHLPSMLGWRVASSIVSGPDMPGRSSASRDIRRGSPLPPTDCSTTTGWRVLRPIQPEDPVTARRAAGAASATSGCMGRLARTGRAMTRRSSRGSPASFSRRRLRAMSGACSTTPPQARRSRTRSSCRPCWPPTHQDRKPNERPAADSPTCF